MGSAASARPPAEDAADVHAPTPRAARKANDVSIAIIGAGCSGICMGIHLLKAGYHNFTIYEAADAIGGTWRDNTYPGCACDVSSTLYAFSFEPGSWKEFYSGQPDILQYLQHCVDKYGLKPHIRLNSRIESAVFDEQQAQWHITTEDGQEAWTQVLVLGQGGLVVPSIPKIPGLNSFRGTIIHSAKWDHSCDLTNKRVAVVGTGASAVQIIPSIQPLVKKLFVFQRTPGWVFPRKAFKQTNKRQTMQLSAAAVGAAAAVAAAGANWLTGVPAAVAAAATVAAAGVAVLATNDRVWLWFQRQATFWNAERQVGPAIYNNNPKTNAELQELALHNLNQSVSDPVLRAKLTPTFSIGCKRVLITDTYYHALQQNNVELVSSAVQEVTSASAVIAEDGSTASDVDAIIFATGFDVAASLQFKTLTIKGLGGRDLSKTLADTPYSAYLGFAVPGFPNMFILMGPNTILGHSSMIFMIECGVNLAMNLIRKVGSSRRKFNSWWEVTESAQQRFSDEARDRLQGSVWLAGGCNSWYMAKGDESAPKSSDLLTNGDVKEESDQARSGADSGIGKARAAGESSGKSETVVMWLGGCVEYWWRTLWARKADWKCHTVLQ